MGPIHPSAAVSDPLGPGPLRPGGVAGVAMGELWVILVTHASHKDHQNDPRQPVAGRWGLIATRKLLGRLARACGVGLPRNGLVRVFAAEALDDLRVLGADHSLLFVDVLLGVQNGLEQFGDFLGGRHIEV